jgi:hypothetical protein
LSFRKIERVEFPLGGEPGWKDIAFSELEQGNIFKITDIDDNGKIAIDGEDGKKILVATSKPYYKDETLTIETEEIKPEVVKFLEEEVSE